MDSRRPHELSTWGEVEVAQAPRPLSPGESPRHFFGAELRFWRERREMSQDDLGKLVHVSGDLLSRIEKAERWPPPGFAEDCDAALNTEGALARVWPLVERTRVDRRTSGGKYATHVDNIEPVLQFLADNGTMQLSVDEEGNVRAEVNRRSFIIGSAAALLSSGIGESFAGSTPGTPIDEDPFGFVRVASEAWPGLRLVKQTPDNGTDWHAIVPGGRAMLGAETSLQIHPAVLANNRVRLNIADRKRTSAFVERPGRGLVVGAASDGDESKFYILDSRSAQRHGEEHLTFPAAYELDDLTYGLLWAVSNYDTGLQADDRALAETHADLKSYERLSASAVSREAAPGLNTVAHMWLGSDFCARHILKALPDLPQLPLFWTREQRGEEASAWLIFDHKYPYLRETTKALGGSATTRAFCVPENVVRASPRYERALLFLAVALMESLGIQAQFTTDAAYESVEGFVVAPNQEAIIANWVRGDGMWHVDVTDRSSIVREFTSVALDVGDTSTISGPTSQDRLRALASYLDLPWSWLVSRCAALGRYGTANLLQPRSRLVSTAGIDAACAFVGSLSMSV